MSRSTALAMEELMRRWTRFAEADDAVRALVTGERRVSGTDRRITWRTKAVDGSSVVVTSEPKKNGTASLVATQIGVPTAEANEEARRAWTDAVERFVATL
ncbi:hypothetical protein [Thalassiella azotivora]